MLIRQKISPFYSLPPTGHRIPLSVLVDLYSRKGESSGEVFLNPLKEYLGTPHILFLPSGRAALWLILKVLSRRKPKRNEVVVPAYTCPALVSAVLQAKLKPVLCDISFEDFGYSLEKLGEKIGPRTLAVVVVHLFGYPADTRVLMAWGREEGFFTIEDAAQAFGNMEHGGRGVKLGLSGDAGFFSFGRGKPLSALHGGLFVTSSEELYSEGLKLHADLDEPRTFERFKYPFLVAAYDFFMDPRLYWMPQAIPWLHLGETLFDGDFGLFRGLDMALRVVNGLLESVDHQKSIREANARFYSSRLNHLPDLVAPPSPSYPYLRYPLRLGDRELRDDLLDRLLSRGTGASLLYPCSLNELKGLREISDDAGGYPNAARLAETLITLPLHEGLAPDRRDEIVSVIREGLRG